MSFNTPTPHNGALKGDIADTVLMSGDPLRAKFVADNWLTDVKQYNNVRGMLGYTGYYKGMRISVQGHGMGIPSIGIYTYELFNHYDVKRIIRIGSAGGLSPKIKVGDIVLAMNVCTDSAYMKQFKLPGEYMPSCDFDLMQAAIETAKTMQMPLKVGTVLSSDIFYHDTMEAQEKWRDFGVLCVEMEAVALYANAVRAGKEALCITTVSDLPFTGEGLSAEDRQKGFSDMIELTLETVLSIENLQEG